MTSPRRHMTQDHTRVDHGGPTIEVGTHTADDLLLGIGEQEDNALERPLEEGQNNTANWQPPVFQREDPAFRGPPLHHGPDHSCCVFGDLDWHPRMWSMMVLSRTTVAFFAEAWN